MGRLTIWATLRLKFFKKFSLIVSFVAEKSYIRGSN